MRNPRTKLGQALPFAECLTQMAGVSIMRLGDTIACPIKPSGLQVEEHAVHADGRAPDSLIIKEGRSGCVMDTSALRQAGNSDGDWSGYLWDHRDGFDCS